MITALNSMTKDELKRGQNIYIGTVGVPDLWVYGVETTKSTYTYTNDKTFVNSLNNNVTVKVGYYKLAQLETQKVDLTNIESDINDLQSSDTDINALITALTNRVTELENASAGGSEWKLAGSAIGTNSISLPTTFNELLVVAEATESGFSPTLDMYPICTATIPKQALSSTNKYYALTNFNTNTSKEGYCEIYANLSSLNLYVWFSNAIDIKSYATTTVYYR